MKSIEPDSNLDTSMLYNNVEDQITSKTESYDEHGVVVGLSSWDLACESLIDLTVLDVVAHWLSR